MNELNTQNQEQEEVSKVESIINSKSFLKDQQDLYFICDYLQGFTYINNQIKQYQGDSNVIAQLIPHLKIKSIKQGEAIYRKSQKNDYIYFIMKGKVSSWKSKSKESIDQEKNIINQIEKLQKLIEFETQLKQDKKNKQENNKKIPQWERELEQMRKQLNILQKYDFKLSSIFKNEDGINTACFEKIYNRRVDIFGYSNNLYNTRPIHTMIAESDCQFLIITGEDFYSVFNKEVQKIKFLLRVLYNQFSSVDKTILLALAQQFKSMFYDLNQEIYSLNSQTHLGSSQLKKSLHVNHIEQNLNQIAFFIIYDGTILVKETQNGSDYNIFSLSQESIIGVEKYAPSFGEDFENSNIRFISTTNKLQLLGITKKAIEEVQQTHNNYQIAQTLTELGQQRSKFIIQHLEQIKQLLNPMQINSLNTDFSQQEKMQNLIQNKSDKIKNISKYGFVNNLQNNNNNQKQNQQIENQETNLMLKSCQKNQKMQIYFVPETENQKSQAYLKSIVNNMLKFRPSKQKINSNKEINQSPQQFIKQNQETNFKTKNFQINKDSPYQISSKQQKISESQVQNVDQLKSQSLYSNYFNEQSTPISQHVDKKVLKSKLSNQQSQDLIKFGQEINIQKSHIQQQAKNLIKDTEKSVSPRQLEIYNIESQNDQDQDLIQLDSNGNKNYEKYYRQLSFDEIGESTKTFQNQVQTNYELKKIPYKQQNSQQSEYIEFKSVNNQKSNISFQQKVDPTATPQQKNNTQKQFYQQQKKDQKDRNNQSVKMMNNSKDRSNSQQLLNIKDLRQQLNLNSFDHNISLKKAQSTERNNFYNKLRHSQDSLLVQEEFLAQELKLNEDFELKNGKLIQKKPPSFSDLREDFISSDNPYKQCADIIEKYKLISESNKEFIEKNCQNYFKQIQKQVDEYKQVLILKKKFKHNLDKSNQIHNKSKIFTSSKQKFKSQNSQAIQTSLQTPISQYSYYDSLNNSNTSKMNQNFSAFLNLNRQYSPLIQSESPLFHSQLQEYQSSLFQYNAQSQLSQSTYEQSQQKQFTIQQPQNFSLSQNQALQCLKMQNQQQTDLSSQNNVQSSFNVSKFYNAQEQTTERQSSQKQIKKIESIFQKCSRNNQNLKKQNSKNEASEDYSNSPPNIIQINNKFHDNITNFSYQSNINDSSLIMVRSLQSANKKKISRPQSVQINKFLKEKYAKDQALSFHIQQSLENSSFLPSNSYVNMMPSFEPKLQMNSINRPKTANNFKLTQNQHKKNRINMNLNGDDASSILQISSINQNARGINNLNQKQFDAQHINQFKIQSVFAK
ncbi:cyclic nucleotide-binding domain protein (macronuclear) [Tetrahymena thermophila SB210]|uniref:Cyclic nucleotide-binding domain protein n=1 Tax=Tetrahymena thermophila (strain SB210) TaxID=312017 RepID=I7M2X9_TETTS|nr:cyclic nucleotide-binding domain protein [Tetrahymena thermophila SB210]EAS01502.1 cyclic nucleotide-binding domain protein [Tetrahymena thermophila SB210]|eukprot:XP_001021748.1 cyclic nucleotide-binding domain protein [Tetrahymena thermophila SB210]